MGRKLQTGFDPQELLATLDWVTVAPFETEHALDAAELETDLHRDEGVNRDKINSLTGNLRIAAVAKAENTSVVTRDTDDFDRFAGVATESYRFSVVYRWYRSVVMRIDRYEFYPFRMMFRAPCKMYGASLADI